MRRAGADGGCFGACVAPCSFMCHFGMHPRHRARCAWSTAAQHTRFGAEYERPCSTAKLGHMLEELFQVDSITPVQCATSFGLVKCSTPVFFRNAPYQQLLNIVREMHVQYTAVVISAKGPPALGFLCSTFLRHTRGRGVPLRVAPQLSRGPARM